MMRWRRMKAQFAYRREKAKSKAKPKKVSASPEFSGFCLSAIALLGFYFTQFPHHSGIAGQMVARNALWALGNGGSFFFWVGIGYRGLRLLLHKEDRRPWRYLLVDMLLLAVACALLTAFGALFLMQNPGGHLGKMADTTLAQMFGRWGALLIDFFALGALLLWRSGQRPGQALAWIWQHLAGDLKEWREAVAFEKNRAIDPAPKRPFPHTTDAGRRSEASRSGREEGKPVVAQRPPEPPPFMKSTPTVVSQAPPMPPNVAKKMEQEAAPLKATEGVDETPAIPFERPALELLTVPERSPVQRREEDLLASAQHLEKTLADFGVQGKVVEIHPGPIITRFDYTPAPGIKVQAVANLSNDIALAMKALSVRILAPIPGKSAVGIELPNPVRAIVRLREVLETTEFINHRSKLAIGLGKDAEGHPVIGDLAAMPHLLIAGSTGAGKSVCIHALVMSLMYRSTPQEVKLMMIDPKRLELPLYNGIPYLYDPNQNPENVRVITDSKEAAKSLEGMVKVMDARFKKFAAVMARDIEHYNAKMAAEGLPPESYIVVIIDELADLMAVSPKEVEGTIQRLTQMARAVGIHLVLATQRPSVDVITGVIKANLPSRIAFRVSSQTDSRVILDSSGAESLLGQGDMLFLPPGAAKPTRLQCGLVTSQEVQVIADFVRSQGAPSYERVLTPIARAGEGASDSGDAEELDDLQQALMLVLERRRVSQDLLKAHFGSSARATDLLSQLEIKGFIVKPEGTNRWTIYFDRIDAYLGQLHTQATTSTP